VVSESHFYKGNQSKYKFKMHCWTHPEIKENLRKAGFRSAKYFGAYDFKTLPGSMDRIVIAATL
jgi:hypothetical protein